MYIMRIESLRYQARNYFLQNIIEECSLIYQDCIIDSITPIRMWDKEFIVDLDSMNPENTEAGIPVLNAPGTLVFTDGSKSKQNDKTGAGVVFYQGGVPVEITGTKLIYSFRLRDQNSVFQTEVWSIKKAVTSPSTPIHSLPLKPLNPASLNLDWSKRPLRF